MDLNRAIPYLMRCKLLEPAAIVAGSVHVEDASRRNRNLMVLCEAGHSYMVKQGLDGEGRATVAREAVLYAHFWRSDRTTGLTAYLPRLYFYDAADGILVLELCRELQDLRRQYLRRQPGRVTAGLGAALSSLHRSSWPAEFSAAPPPYILSIHRPDRRMLPELSGGALHMIRILQHSPELADALDALRAEWQGDALVHGDLRSDNCLAGPSAEGGQLARVKLVDWEMAQPGDPSWDVGSVFGECLSTWLASMPLTSDVNLEEAMELAQCPLEPLQRAMRAFWRAYVRESALSVTEAARRLNRAVRHTAAWLIQSTFEQAQARASLTSTLVYQLQLSLNIVRDPERGAVELLGIANPLGRGCG